MVERIASFGRPKQVRWILGFAESRGEAVVGVVQNGDKLWRYPFWPQLVEDVQFSSVSSNTFLNWVPHELEKLLEQGFDRGALAATSRLRGRESLNRSQPEFLPEQAGPSTRYKIGSPSRPISCHEYRKAAGLPRPDESRLGPFS